MVLAIILLVLLGVSVLFNASSFLGGLFSGRGPRYARTAGQRLEEVIYEDNDAANKLAIVEVNGIITGVVIDGAGFNLVDLIKAQLKRAEEDDRV